ncbi:hypothetical protein FA240_05120 [Pseudomonas aeruginosa]|nr:hypothetical protein [Pseudomonas aeruginosa]
MMMLLRWITIAVSRSHVGKHSPVGRMGATAGCREERRPERPAQGMLLSRQASGGAEACLHDGRVQGSGYRPLISSTLAIQSE